MVPVIEISVDSVESAIAAEQGGAHRIELCSALREGGLTPSLGLVRQVKVACKLPLFVIVRPRSGDFFYTEHEFRTMQEDIRVLQQERVDGVVFGVLACDGTVDKARTSTLVSLASELPVTFHRAFDMTSNLEQALENVAECGVQRLLTSGGAPSAWEGRTRLHALVRQAGSRLTIVVGGGVRPSNISELIAETGATEFHSSMRRTVPSPMLYQAKHMSLGEPGCGEFTRTLVSADEVRDLLAAANRARYKPATSRN